jgi:hypothetical protein
MLAQVHRHSRCQDHGGPFGSIGLALKTVNFVKQLSYHHLGHDISSQESHKCLVDVDLCQSLGQFVDRVVNFRLDLIMAIVASIARMFINFHGIG